MNYITCYLLFFLLTSSSPNDQSARGFIIGAGGEIVGGNATLGEVAVSGERAFPLIEDSKGTVLAAAAETEKTRTVVFGHGAFLTSARFHEQEAVRRVVTNSIRWASHSESPKVGIHPKMESLSSVLRKAGIEPLLFGVDQIGEHDVDVYCVVGKDLAEERLTKKLSEFVKGGGGLVVAVTPMALRNNFPDFSKFPGNQLLASTGIQYLQDGVAAEGPVLLRPSSGATVTGRPDPEMVQEHGGTVAEKAARALAVGSEAQSPGARDKLIAQMRQAQSLVGAELESFLVALRALNESVGPIVPNKENPVIPGEDPLVDAIMELEQHFNETAPAGVMYAIPAANDYPGKVPDDADRITKRFTIDGTYRGWAEGRLAGAWAAKEMRPTGIYAAPGEVIKVTLPSRVAGEGFEVVIGSYNGSLRKRERWFRYSDWQVKVPVESGVTSASSGLGGLVTIRVPRGAKHDSLEVSIEGGVAAPLYVHGETDPDQWVSEIRDYPGPWAELASDRIIIAVPSEFIRDLSDPDALMEVWNGIFDTSAVLAGVDRNDFRAERIVFDRQTGAGSMHSGYPVAAHLRSAEIAVNAKLLKSEGSWGFFHEYGHNYQHNLWQLPNTVETTCNLWSVYIYEQYIGKDRDDIHGGLHPLKRRQLVNEYFETGPDFNKWSVGTALQTYLMVQEKFGWEPFTKVFVEYDKLQREDWPMNQQERNDQWVIRLSKACGMNLEPFWSTWGLPLSDSVSDELKSLPVWEDHPVARFAKSES